MYRERQITDRKIVALGAARGRESRKEARTWPLHNIAITNIVWYIAYKRGGAYLAQQSWNTTVTVGITVGGGNERMMDSCTKALK